MISHQHLFWLLLVIVNFLIQIIYFYKDQNNRLFWGKKITTPALLFGGLVLVLISEGSFSWASIIIFIAMGLGELGIEGSSVVQKRHKPDKVTKSENIIVVVAGIIFLLVNIFLGSILIIGNSVLLISLFASISILFYGTLNFLFFKIVHPSQERIFQIRVYSFSLVVLLTGVLTDISQGLSPFGLAAAILCLSDTLVLIRMGADFDKRSRKGFNVLFVFLIVILILYYFYMALLIHNSNPFWK